MPRGQSPESASAIFSARVSAPTSLLVPCVTVIGLSSVGGLGAFLETNADKLHMVLPSDHPELPWTALLVFAGMQLGANWETVGAWLKRFEYAIVAVLVVIAVAWIWVRIIKPRRAAQVNG